MKNPRVFVVTFGLVALCFNPAFAADHLITGKVAVAKSGKLLKFVSKSKDNPGGVDFVIPAAGAGDPTQVGAISASSTRRRRAGDLTFNLDTYGWSALGGGAKGYKYKGAMPFRSTTSARSFCSSRKSSRPSARTTTRLFRSRRRSAAISASSSACRAAPPAPIIATAPSTAARTRRTKQRPSSARMHRFRRCVRTVVPTPTATVTATSDGNGHQHTDRHHHADGDEHVDSNEHAGRYRNSDGDSDADEHLDRSADEHRHQHQHGNGHAHEHADRHPDADRRLPVVARILHADAGRRRYAARRRPARLPVPGGWNNRSGCLAPVTRTASTTRSCRSPAASTLPSSACRPSTSPTSVRQTGCGVGRIDSNGGSDFTITEVGDTSSPTARATYRCQLHQRRRSNGAGRRGSR